MVYLILLISLSIITARCLEKRYKVASIFHSVFFAIMLFLALASSDVEVIKKGMLNWMGEYYYKSLYDAIKGASSYIHIGAGGLMIVDIVVFIFVPILSIVSIIAEFKEQFKEMKIRVNIKLFVGYIINLVLDPIKDFKHNKNETYLILGKLLN